MFDIQTLLGPRQTIYIKIPAASRKKSFVAYKFSGDDQDLAAFDKLCPWQYYIAKALTPRQKTVIVIPFKLELSPEQYQSLSFDFSSSDYLEKFAVGEIYRTTQSNQKFVLKHANADLLNGIEHTENNELHYNIDSLSKALADYLKSPEWKRVADDDLQRRHFLKAFATDVYDQAIDSSDVDKIKKQLNHAIPNFDKEYDQAYKEISQSKIMRETFSGFPDRFSTFFPKSKTNPTLSGQFQSQIQEVGTSSKIKLETAGDNIARFYKPALLNEDGDDIDKVVIFDNTKGIWVHDKDTFNALLNVIKPYSSRADLQTLMSTFASRAHTTNNYIEPYSDSRYLVFRNCVVDLKIIYEALQQGKTPDQLHGEEQLSLTSTKVKDLHFTERSQLDLDYNPKVVEPPEFPGKLKFDDGKGQVWDPHKFFMAYAENNPAKYKFLMFGLSLGLFGGHNFGVHFDIKGESRWGKTTLSKIYQNLYPNRIHQDTYSKLNEQFGFTNFKRNTSVIWLRECNQGSKPLNSSYGTTVYDVLGDDKASIQIKGANDLTIKYPPQVFIDGTAYISADNMDTGPAGRTLAYKLPMESDPDLTKQNLTLTDLVHQAYSNDIDYCLRDETVLQYLINQMIIAYLTTLNYPDDINQDVDNLPLWSLKLNLGGRNQDEGLLPDFARQWRKEMSQTAGDLKEWFDDEFKPYLSTDQNNPTIMHDALAYVFYHSSYRYKHSNEDPHDMFVLKQQSFTTQLHKLYDDSDMIITQFKPGDSHPSRTTIHRLADTNFQIARFKQNYDIPEVLTDEHVKNQKHGDAHTSYPLGRRNSGWYKISNPHPVIDI